MVSVTVTEHSFSSFEGRGVYRESVTTTTIISERHTLLVSGIKRGNCTGPNSRSTGLYKTYASQKDWAQANDCVLG